MLPRAFLFFHFRVRFSKHIVIYLSCTGEQRGVGTAEMWEDEKKIYAEEVYRCFSNVLLLLLLLLLLLPLLLLLLLPLLDCSYYMPRYFLWYCSSVWMSIYVACTLNVYIQNYIIHVCSNRVFQTIDISVIVYSWNCAHRWWWWYFLLFGIKRWMYIVLNLTDTSESSKQNKFI